MRVGALIEYRLRLHGVPVSWLTRIEEWEPGVRFVDAQLTGPYKLWHHTHEFAPDGEGGTIMRDTVRYALPYGPLASSRAGCSWRATSTRSSISARDGWRRRSLDRERALHALGGVGADRAEELVLAGLEVGGDRRLAARDGVGLLVHPVALDLTACGVLSDRLSKLIVTVPALASSSVLSNFSEPSAGAESAIC